VPERIMHGVNAYARGNGCRPIGQYLCVAVCCGVLRCVAVCCRGLLRVAVCYCVVQCAAVYCSTMCRVLHGLNAYVQGNMLQHAATHCNTLQHTATHRNTPQHTATLCNICTRLRVSSHRIVPMYCNELLQCAVQSLACGEYVCAGLHTAPCCNTRQQLATPCNTLQHIATHRNTLQHSATYARGYGVVVPSGNTCVLQ